MEGAIDLTMLKKYSNEWVALSSDESKVVSSATTAIEALEKAIELGEKDPILTRVPENYNTYIL